MSQLEILRQQRVFVRRYTNDLLDQIDVADWFRQPAEGVSHIAWQVGHLAMAEYCLALERIRGARPDDAMLIAPAFLALFGKGSQPQADVSLYPSPEALRGVYDRVHIQALAEWTQFREDELALPPHKPHRLFNTRGESLAWCAQHEMLHAGQIGLLRRLLGAAPVW